jgi:hypothetical protein
MKYIINHLTSKFYFLIKLFLFRKYYDSESLLAEKKHEVLSLTEKLSKYQIFNLINIEVNKEYMEFIKIREEEKTKIDDVGYEVFIYNGENMNMNMNKNKSEQSTNSNLNFNNLNLQFFNSISSVTNLTQQGSQNFMCKIKLN